ncbi:cytochrome o ubiquinol oxidase subunit II [Novosphingobium nitrogenifigens DSM 19370]|uniref:Ubiquinol oxidase polypeptide II n=1 Tax=Novosphingobium nitrogenifigens DSM 19370 TaxID=983920 RepID=F1ZDX5_9SPHN|nr:ubiquinol oxidase subunit II [Novosphingobium nitrogenifigens]EGD57188.1 cytochrome o ubiquinol oxidase subunit II [Novosphingobium nitrogenifigens DSM 19370]
MREKYPSASRRLKQAARGALVLPLAALLSGCDWVVLNPSGDIARQQANLVVVSTALMLLIIVPVMLLTVLFAWKYRSGNTNATYDPEFHHSAKLELVIWSAPLAIIIALGSITWLTTHKLDPYRPLDRIDANTPVAPGTKPMDVEVVALDWKWLFIYPEQKIATVNELVLPEGRPVRFRITSSTVMNSFYVPALAGQIYAMPGMETKLHAVFNKTGNFKGFSANFSGSGFSYMHFATRSVTPDAFNAWVGQVQKDGGNLDRATYLELDKPSEHVPVIHYAAVAPDLFDAVVNMCVRPGKLCTGEMAAIDARGGTGKAGVLNVAALTYDKFGREQVTTAAPGMADATVRRFVRAYCADNRPLRASVARDAVPASLAAPTKSGPKSQTLGLVTTARPPLS